MQNEIEYKYDKNKCDMLRLNTNKIRLNINEIENECKVRLNIYKIYATEYK